MRSKMESSNSSKQIIYNGVFLPASQALAGADNRGFRYGDGLFETMKVCGNRIMLSALHFERLAAGLSKLNFSLSKNIDAGHLSREILALCHRNGHAESARVRLMFFRGDGGLQDPGAEAPSYIIQSWDWKDREWNLNGKGLTLGVFPDGRKSCDGYANIKSNNYLLYSMASQYARRMVWDDCLVLNSRDRIADSTIANCWYGRSGVIYTPSLGEGCVAGVMRRWLLERLPQLGFRVEEKATDVHELEAAEGVFLTNALRGVQWVERFGNRVYSRELADRIVPGIYKNMP